MIMKNESTFNINFNIYRKYIYLNRKKGQGVPKPLLVFIYYLFIHLFYLFIY
eukprot:gene6186-4463_t